MKISLLKVKDALIGIEGEGWDAYTINYVDEATENLNKLLESLEFVSVKGRENIDGLLGCMMALEMIIGKEE